VAVVIGGNPTDDFHHLRPPRLQTEPSTLDVRTVVLLTRGAVGSLTNP